jgi:hypothetical protein
MQSARYSCQILMELWFSWYVFEKSSNIKFHKMRPEGAVFHADGQTRTHDEGNSRFWQFYERD